MFGVPVFNALFLPEKKDPIAGLLAGYAGAEGELQIGAQDLLLAQKPHANLLPREWSVFSPNVPAMVLFDR